MLAGFYNQEKDAQTYQQELRYWLAKTNACGVSSIVNEKKTKLLQLLLGNKLENGQNIQQIRNYIKCLLTCENSNRVLTNFPETPKIHTQFIASKCKLLWEKMY